MGYRVNYRLLDAMYDQLNSQATKWEGELDQVKDAANRLVQTDNMSGTGADAMRSYFTKVHLELVQSLTSLVKLHLANFTLYMNEYQSTIDTAFDVIIDEEELAEIVRSINTVKNDALDIDSSIRSELRKVDDIFSVTFRSVTDVADILDQAAAMCTALDQGVTDLESRHAQSAFANTSATIGYLTTSVNAALSQGRSFKTDFDPNGAVYQAAFGQLSAINAALINDLNGKSAALEAAVEYHNARKEMENRIETAKWEKLLVSAAVIVASAVVIAVLPVSGPLVVGAVSAASSAIIGGNNAYMDLYVVDGDVSGDDWKTVGLEAGKGAVTGFVTGVVGGVAGKAISGVTKGIPALHSANTVVNTATHVAIGSTTEVVTGIATRTASGIIDQAFNGEEEFSWSEVGEKAFSGEEILKDAILGGIDGYYEGHKVDYSESMHSDYEQAVLDDMRKSGELETYVDPELDAASLEPADPLTYDMKPVRETNVWEDYFVKKKDDGLTWNERITPDKILTPDDYSHGRHNTVNQVKDIFEKGEKAIDKSRISNDPLSGDGPGYIKGDDQILKEAYKNTKQGQTPSGGGSR